MGFFYYPDNLPLPPSQVFALQRQLSDANASSAEIGASSAALMDLVGEGPALQAMLNCYSHKIRLDQSLLLKQHTAGGQFSRQGRCASRGRRDADAVPMQRVSNVVWSWHAMHAVCSLAGEA